MTPFVSILARQRRQARGGGVRSQAAAAARRGAARRAVCARAAGVKPRALLFLAAAPRSSRIWPPKLREARAVAAATRRCGHALLRLELLHDFEEVVVDLLVVLKAVLHLAQVRQRVVGRQSAARGPASRARTRRVRAQKQETRAANPTPRLAALRRAARANATAHAPRTFGRAAPRPVISHALHRARRGKSFWRSAPLWDPPFAAAGRRRPRLQCCGAPAPVESPASLPSCSPALAARRAGRHLLRPSSRCSGLRTARPRGRSRAWPWRRPVHRRIRRPTPATQGVLPPLATLFAARLAFLSAPACACARLLLLTPACLACSRFSLVPQSFGAPIGSAPAPEPQAQPAALASAELHAGAAKPRGARSFAAQPHGYDDEDDGGADAVRAARRSRRTPKPCVQSAAALPCAAPAARHPHYAPKRTLTIGPRAGGWRGRAQERARAKAQKAERRHDGQ